MKVRGSFEFEADYEDVVRGWTDEEKQALHDGDDEAGDAALTALLNLGMLGKADEIGFPTLDIRK